MIRCLRRRAPQRAAITVRAAFRTDAAADPRAATATGGKPARRTYNILSLDGGGVRGVFTACVLSRLNEVHPGFLSSFDLIAGTSTGSILALCLARGLTPDQMMRAYEVACPEIFVPKWYHRWLGRLPQFAKYDNTRLKEYLEEWLGPDLRLQDLEQKVIVTAFCVDGHKSTHDLAETGAPIHAAGDEDDDENPATDAAASSATDAAAAAQTGGRAWRPAVFSNLPTKEGVARSDHSLLAVDAALRSSAAPTYFPIYQGYCDGAMTANNPSLLAVSKALAHYPKLRREDVRVLSIGAGSKLNVFKADALGTGNWGWWQWAPHAIQLLMDSNSLSTDLLAGLMLGNGQQYHRLECVLEEAYYDDIDDEREGETDGGDGIKTEATMGANEKQQQQLLQQQQSKEEASGHGTKRRAKKRRRSKRRAVDWAIDDIKSMPLCVKLARDLNLEPTARFVGDMVENRRAATERDAAEAQQQQEEQEQEQEEKEVKEVEDLRDPWRIAEQKRQKLQGLASSSSSSSSTTYPSSNGLLFSNGPLPPLSRGVTDGQRNDRDDDASASDRLLYEEEAGVRYAEQISTVDDAWEIFSRASHHDRQVK